MMKWILFIFLFLVWGGFVAADEPFQNDDQAYRYGYRQGYGHGMADSQTGLSFDYKHSQNAASGISYDSYDDDHYQNGFKDGYRDGFYGTAAYDMDRDEDFHHDHDADDDQERYDMDRHYDVNNRGAGYYNSRFGGFATVFGDDRFDGSHESFRVGQYPYLDGKMRKSIDSVEVRGPIRVVLFDKPDFRGKRIVIQRDVIDLDDYNFGDKAESMIVEPLY